jgi:hypothetical protein
VTLAYVLSLVAVGLAFLGWVDSSPGELLAAAAVGVASIVVVIADERER